MPGWGADGALGDRAQPDGDPRPDGGPTSGRPADAPDPDELIASLLEHCAFPAPGTPLVCGVSGGADSLALLVLAVAARCEVTAVHVDHGLRPGSAAEAEVVRDVAERHGAAFRAERVEVALGANLEARARAARHAVLGPDAALGHTADDQAETVLVNLLRGAGLHGLAGMRPGPRHPILALRRDDTVAVVRALGLRPVQDPSNDDPVFLRNRVRHELLPLLAELSRRDPVPILHRSSDVLREVADHLDAESEAIDPTDARAVVVAPPAVARAALRRWLRAASGEGHPPDAATVERVLAVARLEARATDVGGGWRVSRRAGRMALEPPTPPSG